MTTNEYNKNEQDTQSSPLTPEIKQENLPEDQRETDKISQKSEEVQATIRRMPTYWVKWMVLCVSVLIGIIVLLGFHLVGERLLC